MRNRAAFVGVENDREITRAGDPQFWSVCQRAVLLALKEEGALSETQYRYAEELLKNRQGRGDG